MAVINPGLALVKRKKRTPTAGGTQYPQGFPRGAAPTVLQDVGQVHSPAAPTSSAKRKPTIAMGTAKSIVSPIPPTREVSSHVSLLDTAKRTGDPKATRPAATIPTIDSDPQLITPKEADEARADVHGRIHSGKNLGPETLAHTPREMLKNAGVSLTPEEEETLKGLVGKGVLDPHTVESIRMAGAGPASPDLEGKGQPKTYQEQLNRQWAGTGKKAPVATEEQELRFAQRQAEALIDRARQHGKGGKIVMGGTRGETTEILPSEVGTKAGIKKARDAARPVTEGGMGIAMGDQTITVGGKSHKIPAWMDADKVIAGAEALRHETVMGGYKKPMDYGQAVKIAMQTEREAYGVDERKPSMIRGRSTKDDEFVGGETTIAHYLNTQRQAKAQAEADRTGRRVLIDQPAGQRGGMSQLHSYMNPSKAAVDARKAREETERKATAKIAMKAASDRKLRKAIKTEDKNLSKWLSVGSNSTRHDKIVEDIESLWNGKIYKTADGSQKFDPRHRPISGAFFSEEGKIVKAEYTPERLGILWKAIKSRYSKEGIPAGAIPYAMQKFIAANPQLDNRSAMKFYLAHREDFKAFLAGTPMNENNVPRAPVTQGELTGLLSEIKKIENSENPDGELSEQWLAIEARLSQAQIKWLTEKLNE